MRMKSGAGITRDDVERTEIARRGVRERLAGLLAEGTAIAVPAAPGLAPYRDGGEEAAWQVVGRNGRINAAAALAGLPQISLPLARVDGVPIGLGLIGRAGDDEMLLDIAVRLAA
jgi:amidase